MAKAAKKATGKTKGKAAKKPAKGGKSASKKINKSSRRLTWLAKGLLATTLLWFVIAGYFAASDVKNRRAGCFEWLTQQNRTIQGYKRVFNTDSEKIGCSVQKLGLRGFIAEPPIYPDLFGLLLVFGAPAGMMGFYLMAFKFRRGLILYQKKKIWAEAGPLDFDDFEDMRDLPDEEEIQAQDEAEAAQKMNAAESMDAALEEAAGQQPAAPAKPAVKKPDANADKKAAPVVEADKTDEAEKPEEELSELEKILRQVDS
ncbi:MAG: hypothetical protein HOE62_08530 [Alphaproteobacteria bacterium]|nr:hypothetical protein [Alphaproteobacteria bacterium]